jgi:hypothetical protein
MSAAPTYIPAWQWRLDLAPTCVQKEWGLNRPFMGSGRAWRMQAASTAGPSSTSTSLASFLQAQAQGWCWCRTMGISTSLTSFLQAQAQAQVQVLLAREQAPVCVCGTWA